MQVEAYIEAGCEVPDPNAGAETPEDGDGGSYIGDLAMPVDSCRIGYRYESPTPEYSGWGFVNVRWSYGAGRWGDWVDGYGNVGLCDIVYQAFCRKMEDCYGALGHVAMGAVGECVGNAMRPLFHYAIQWDEMTIVNVQEKKQELSKGG